MLARTRLIAHRLVGARVRAVQRGSITIPVSGTSQTATIAAVDPAHTRLLFAGQVGDDDGSQTWQQLFARVELTNATTVTAIRNASGAFALTVSYEVIEYWPGVIRSIQRGVVTGATATIAPVNLTRATVDLLGFAYTGASAITGLASTRPRLLLSAADTVTRSGGSNAGYQVIEWR